MMVVVVMMMMMMMMMKLVVVMTQSTATLQGLDLEARLVTVGLRCHLSEDVKHEDDDNETDGHQHDILRGQAHQLCVGGDMLRGCLCGSRLCPFRNCSRHCL